MAGETKEFVAFHPGFAEGEGPQEGDLYKCVHCGLCLSSCPTYVETGLEMESPRGRIALMKAVFEGRVGLSDQIISHWEMCLQCRACEAVCPSGVPFGRLMENTRAQVTQQRPRGIKRRLFRWLAFQVAMPHVELLYFLGSAARLYQRSGARRFVRSSGLLRLLPWGLGSLEAQLPQLRGPFFKPTLQVYAARGGTNAAKGRVALLSGCVMPIFQAPIMEAAVRVLTRNGFEVVVPPGQGCCGALNVHGGERKAARAMARRNIDVFLETGVERIVTASAGCGSTMKEYGELVRDDPEYAEKAERFAAMTMDITELLISVPVDPPKVPLPVRVTYQDSCHLAHAQRITKAPRQLLQAIPGVQFVEMKDSALCCGAAGSYAVVQREMSGQLLDSKMHAVADAGVEVVATANPGCILQLQLGMKRLGLPGRVVHVIELLDEAYALEEEEAAAPVSAGT